MRMTMNKAGLIVLGCLSLLTAMACVEQAPVSSICDQAAGHLAQCTGLSGTASPSVCGAEQEQVAQTILSSSCDEINDPTASGKSDYWENGNPLCVFMVGAKGIEEGNLCCFDRNCAGELVCHDYSCTPKAADGAGCERNDHCTGGLVCGVDGTCSDAVSGGAACNRDSQCAGNLSCVAGQCGELSQEGGKCEEGEDRDCASGLRCEGGLCEPLSTDGGQCQENNDCDGFLTCIAGQCAEESQQGGACDRGDRSDCDFGFACIHEACQPEPGLGDVCEREPRFMCGDGQTCWEASGGGHTCQEVHGTGEVCIDMFDCADGHFCTDGVCAR
jgi:hypothetical protein